MAAEISQSSGNPKQGKVRSKKASTRIDMTPMVDLAFLLLTFFMLTTVFNDPYVMQIEMPKKPDQVDGHMDLSRKQVINIVLGEKNKIYWYNCDEKPEVHVTSFSSDGIRKLIFEKKKEIPQLHILIKPSEKSRYKNMVDILDEMLITTTTKYSLVKITPEDNQLIAESKL